MVEFSVVECRAVQCSAVHCVEVKYGALDYSEVHVQRCAVKFQASVRVSGHQLTRTSENPSGKLRSELSVRLSRGGTVRFVKATQYFLVLPWLWRDPICTVGQTDWGRHGHTDWGVAVLALCI